jgi:hypothetical protein
LSPSREAIPLIRPVFRYTEIVKYHQIVTLQRGHPSISVYLKTGLIREMASLEGDNLVVFYYHSVSENWPDKRGGLSGRGQSSGILLSQCI